MPYLVFPLAHRSACGAIFATVIVGGILQLPLVPAGAWAEEPAPVASVASGGPAEAVLHRLAEGVKKYTLPNGLRVLIYPRGDAPTFSAKLWVKVGGVNEQVGKTGAAHLLEHMAFKGTTTIGTKDWDREKALLDEEELLLETAHRDPEKLDKKRLAELRKELSEVWIDDEYSRIYQKNGAVGLNASTAKDYTNYTVELPTNVFELWCWMESERLVHPVFRQFYKERDVVIEERRMRTDDSPNGRLYEALLATAYWNHPDRFPVIGWPSDVRSLTRRDSEQLHAIYYRPDNMVLALVGKLNPDEVMLLVERYFGRMPKPEGEVPRVTTVEEPQRGEREATVEFDAEPGFIIAFYKPVYPNPDDIYFNVLHSILSDGRSSILYKELVLNRHRAVTIQSSEAPGELHPSLFYVYAVPREGISNRELSDDVQQILDKLKEELVNEKDFEAAKKRLRLSYLSQLDSNSEAASTLAHQELIFGNWRTLFDHYDLTNKTTCEDLRRLARTYLQIPNRTFVHRERPRPAVTEAKEAPKHGKHGK